jgi:ABC-type Fe3+-hydroxamate transport system substrate-binding protein
VASSRFLGVLLSLLTAILLSACADDQSQPPPLQATAASSVGCKSGQAYQHTTLAYHLCFPSGWNSRDYTAEPGSGGALSVVAFGPPSTVPAHVPASGTFLPPIEVRVVAGPKDQQEASLAQGNQVTQTTVAGVTADKIMVVDSGPANGSVIIVLEHQGNTFEIEEAPGGTYDNAFAQVVSGFSFPTS